MDEEKGYVIRCLDLYNGSTMYQGCKGIVSKNKEEFVEGDTYTFDSYGVFSRALP